jgi:Flp pilus assembly protein TadG
VKNQRTAAALRFFMSRSMPPPETSINDPIGDPKVRARCVQAPSARSSERWISQHSVVLLYQSPGGTMRRFSLRRPPAGRRSRGQSLAEFALVFPIFIAMIGGIVQFGLAFWAQNTLTQVVRDTGRWEATQQVAPCDSNATAVVAKANAIASTSALFAYKASAPFVAYTPPATPTEGVAVSWARDPSDTSSPPQPCPPSTNESIWYVTITVRHEIPTFFPGLTYLPALGTCDASGCKLVLSSTATYRMEPKEITPP